MILKYDENLSKDRGKDERTALHFAASAGHEEVVELLANERNSLIEARDTFGNTPLHDASRNGNESCVNILLKMGAKTKTKLVDF